MEDITFVTAYYKTYDDGDAHLIDNFNHFFSKWSEASVVLFLDPVYAHLIAKFAPVPNIKIINTVAFGNLSVAKLFAPDCNNMPGNKLLVLMNSKLEFIKLAQISTRNAAWIDFGMSLTNVNDDWMQKLHVPQSKILLPGCIRKSPVPKDSCHPRFRGGFVCGTLQNMLAFHDYAFAHLSETKVLNWEVNVWAELEHLGNFFQWYYAHDDASMFNFPPPIKVMLILMIKNEERIIKRCINNALTIADAICILDTGSTNLEVLTEYLPTLCIPSRITYQAWQNFGHNRTLSLQASQEFCKDLGWNPEFTYGLLLDADMKIVQTNHFEKTDLIAKGYRILQRNGDLEYYNTRFVQLAETWKSVGVTHEFWDGPPCEVLDSIFIQDLGDGGCKHDKFIRDERLLTHGLENEPTNTRYMFYLAQTLKDLKKVPEAIKMYERRILAGGWSEEVWYSMYSISKLKREIGDLIDMEYWGLKAFEYNKHRAENLYFLTRVFREISQHYKAWHYMQLGSQIKKPTAALFIEPDVYTHLFDYEKTILNYYVEKRDETALRHLIDYYNRQGGHCYSNLQFYVNPIQCVCQKLLPFPLMDDFVPSSTSFVKYAKGYLLNVRYVNYRIKPNGEYVMKNTTVITRNFMVQTDVNFNVQGPLEEMIPTFPPKCTTHIQGLEDLRLYLDGDKIKWIAASMDYTTHGTIRQITGTFDTEARQLTDAVCLFSQSQCEKNWIPYQNEFIYSWGPFQLCKADGITLTITHTQQTPKFFEHMRGSTNIAEFRGALFCITHVVQYPRKYYHIVVRINKSSRQVEAYTSPFYFKTNAIEYTLGMDISDGGLMNVIVSQNDMNPMLCTIDMSTLRFYDLEK